MVYANGAEVASSAFDFRLRFGQVLESKGDQIRIKELVSVYVSPEHAKSFLFLLAGRVTGFEETFGKIPGQDFDVEIIEKRSDSKK